MAHVLNDRIKETTTTTGTGNISLAGAETGFETFVSGIGNIYANEVLFMSGINPMRISKSLKKNEIIKLTLSIKSILKFSISRGGSSIRDFKNTLGKTGGFQQFFKVYGRENKNCSRIWCNGKVKKIFLSNRSSFFCSICQK